LQHIVFWIQSKQDLPFFDSLTYLNSSLQNLSSYSECDGCLITRLQRPCESVLRTGCTRTGRYRERTNNQFGAVRIQTSIGSIKWMRRCCGVGFQMQIIIGKCSSNRCDDQHRCRYEYSSVWKFHDKIGSLGCSCRHLLTQRQFLSCLRRRSRLSMVDARLRIDYSLAAGRVKLIVCQF